MKAYEFTLNQEVIDLLFAEVRRIRQEHPDQCLAPEQLWNDATEKANGITRDRNTNTLCYTVTISSESGAIEESYSLREDSSALQNSALYQMVSKLVAPYESLPNVAHVT